MVFVFEQKLPSVRDLVSIEQFDEFLFETFHAVMFFLVLDVKLDGVEIGLADGERGVSTLPVKMGWRYLFAVYPGRRAAFDIADGVADRDVWSRISGGSSAW